MKRTQPSRQRAAREQYVQDCFQFGVARADELAHFRQLTSLDLLKLEIADELGWSGSGSSF